MSRNRRIKKEIPRTIQIYWHCSYCGDSFPWPQMEAKVYCSPKCMYAAGYQRKKKSQSPEGM